MILTGCGGSTATSGTPNATADEIADFRDQRNTICAAGSADISQINATIEDAELDAQIAAFEQIVERIRETQVELDNLIVPAAMAAFVTANNERRAERIRLVGELSAALATGDESLATSIDEELTELNVETESEEDANGLVHCP